jgi:hypothetical protein
MMGADAIEGASMQAEEVLEKHQDRLMSIDGVEGVGLGGTADAPVILVMVRQGGAEMRSRLPAQLEGYPVKVDVVGEVRAY